MWFAYLEEGGLWGGREDRHFHANVVSEVAYVGSVRRLGRAVFFRNILAI